MSEKGGFDYLDSVSKDGGGNKNRLSNLQVEQTGMDAAPSEGGEGFVGGNPNASAVGTNFVTGKKGYTIDRKLWDTQTSRMGLKENAGSSDGDANGIEGQQDPTDEMATYKRIQTDEGLPQTYRNCKGAGDASPDGADEPDSTGVFGRDGGRGDTSYKTDQNIQSLPEQSKEGSEFSELPQTEFTSVEGGGAPMFKRG